MFTMRRNAVFVATAVLTLGIAIGGTTAMFTVIRAVLLNPLEYRAPDRLVRMSGGATPTRFAEMKAAAHSFAEIAAFTGQEHVTLSGGGEPEVLNAVHVSANFLRVLDVHPLSGRAFRDEDDLPGAAQVAMISAELWHRRFKGDPRVAGSVVTLGAAPYMIAGVVPAHFQFPFAGLDVWLPAPSELASMAPKSRALSPFLTIFGRLMPGIRIDQANAALSVIRRQYATAHPAMLDAKPKSPAELTPMKDDLVAGVREMLWMLFGAVGFVLTIACANMASLMLTRSAGRAREFAIRSALGAGRSRLMGQLLAESVLLSLPGGTLGVFLAALIVQWVPKITAFNLPRSSEIHMDVAVIAFAALLSAGTGILFGLVPAISASRPDPMRLLRTGGQGANTEHGGLFAGWSVRNLLCAGQIALSVVLLIGAALLIESVANLRNVKVGFNPANLLTVSIALPPLRYETDAKKAAFFDDAVRRMRSIPGARSAAAAMSLPMMGYPGTPVQDAAKPRLKLNERLIAKIFPVTAEYFRTLNIPLMRGRDFNERDTQDAQRVAIIDESLARRFWPGYPAQNPVGQHLLVGGINANPAEIIGVVADIHQSLDNRSEWRESVYTPFTQGPPPAAILAIRTAGNPLSFAQAVREQIRVLDRDQAIGTVRTMEDRVEAQVGQRRLLVILLGSFAGVALLLALIGIYGVIAYSVVQRVQEMGIRRALGAQRGDILRLVIGKGAALAVAGIVAGIGGAIALTRLMTGFLFHVSPTDPFTYCAIALAFLLAAAAASYVPARRATRIDPMAALRV